MLLNWLICANLGYIQIRKELSMLPEENTHSQHPHNTHKTHIQTTIKTTTGLQPLKDSSHGVSPLRKAWSWEALPCWACRQASSSPWGASSGGNSWCLSLWWDCHHVISHFSMEHNGTFSTCRDFLGQLWSLNHLHTQKTKGLWFLHIPSSSSVPALPHCQQSTVFRKVLHLRISVAQH